MLRSSWKSINTNKIYRTWDNLWKLKNMKHSCKSVKVHEHLQKTMKIFRGWETELESSKVFYRGSKSNLNWSGRFWSHMLRNPWNSWKALQIFNNLWQINEIHKHSYKSVKIDVNLRNTMKVSGGQDTSLESGKGFYGGSKSNLE